MFKLMVPRTSVPLVTVVESSVNAEVPAPAKRVVVESVVPRNSIVPAVAALLLVTTARTVSESVDAPKTAEAAIEIVAVSEVVIAAVVAEGVRVTEIGSACDGTTDRTPRPNAATATSAMRLNVVFVDICFLSIVDPRTIRGSA